MKKRRKKHSYKNKTYKPYKNEDAMGWNPLGIWHGECTRATCQGCPYENDPTDHYKEIK